MKNGFTIIELLIAITISTALLGVGVAGYRDFSVRQQIDAGRRQIASELRQIQNLATTGIKPTSGCNGTFDGYRVRFIVSSGVVSSYRVSAVCGGVDNSTQSVALPPNVILSLSPASTTSILFMSVGKGTDLGSTLTINISSTNQSVVQSTTIRVSQTGDIT